MSETDTKEILQKIQKYGEDYLSGKKDPCHDFRHLRRVQRIACHILKEEGIQDSETIFVTRASAFLHDVGDTKLKTEDEDSELCLRELLSDELHLTDRVVLRILHVVNNVSFSKQMKTDQSTIEQTIELQIVRDADRLDASGFCGISRCFSYGGSAPPNFAVGILPRPMVREINEREDLDTSLKHFDDKLIHLIDYYHTATAKRIGLKRHKVIVEFKEGLEKEVNEFYNPSDFMDEYL